MFASSCATITIHKTDWIKMQVWFKSKGIKLSIKEIRSIKSLNLTSPSINAKDLWYVGRLTHLKSLDLSFQYAVTDVSLKYLQNLTNLETIRLFQIDLKGTGFKYLKKLRKLKTINMLYSKTTDEGFAYLSEMKSVKSLLLNSHILTDKGFVHIKKLVNLEHLTVICSKVTDRGLGFLGKLRRLKYLHFYATITGTGLVPLSKLPDLKELNLTKTGISDNALKYLYKLKNLSKLNLENTQMTSKGVEMLKKRLPKCKIIFWRWPLTIKDAVDVLLKKLTKKQQDKIRRTKLNTLSRYHHGLGRYIRNNMGLWNGNTALLKACNAMVPDSASSVIIEALWKRLQKIK